MSQKHRHYFNKLASEWSDRMPDDPQLRELLIRFDIHSGDTILDAGAGTGRMTLHLADLAGKTGKVVAQDFAFQMMRYGRQRCFREEIDWVCDDLNQLSLKSDVFDKVVCFSVFPHIQHPLSALKEIHRVLKPKGKMLILHTSGSVRLNQFHASLKGIVKNDHLLASDLMAQVIGKAGFQVIVHHDHDDLYWIEAEKK